MGREWEEEQTAGTSVFLEFKRRVLGWTLIEGKTI